MEARTACIFVFAALASMGASHRTANFIVSAPSAEVAQRVGIAAEKYRRELALEWLGRVLPNWSQPCPVTVDVGPGMGAGGATSFVFDHGEVFGWQMSIQGSLERVLDSVLPHEVTHTVFATHFRQPLPRWADEGASSTVEHTSERIKQQKMLVRYLKSGRGIAFSHMFAMKEYPRDILPLYAQGHSLATFLIDQGGKHKFVSFVSAGLEEERWGDVLSRHYGFDSLGQLQNAWVDWVRQGSPLSAARAGLASKGPANAHPPVTPAGRGPDELTGAVAANERRRRPEPNLIYRTGRNGPDNETRAAGPRGDALDGPVVSQVTRPQAVEEARQVVLEWEKPPRQAGGQGSGASQKPHQSAPKRSVYDTRIDERGVMRR